MSEPLRHAFLFLINTLFDLYLLILVIRIVLVWIHSDYFNPLVQFIIKMTNVLVKPTRRFVPNIRRLETASIVWIVLIEIIKFTLLCLLSFGLINIAAVIILSLGDIIKLIVQTFFYAIILQAILSWLQPHSPINYTLYRFTSPLLRPIQRVVPQVGGIDISPIPALILLQLILIMIVNPVMTTGWSMVLV